MQWYCFLTAKRDHHSYEFLDLLVKILNVMTKTNSWPEEEVTVPSDWTSQISHWNWPTLNISVSSTICVCVFAAGLKALVELIDSSRWRCNKLQGYVSRAGTEVGFGIGHCIAIAIPRLELMCCPPCCIFHQ